MNFRKFIPFILALGLILTACSSGQQTTASTLHVGWAGSPDTLNPGTAVLSEAYTIFELVYDSMYQLSLDGTYSLELADSVDVSEDGTIWTFHIRDGIKFHDGKPLTAEDIAFSYNFYKDNEDFPYLNVYTSYFDTIEAPDASTVVITLSEAIPNMESQLIFLYVLPKHIWESVNPTEYENTDMIGSGPFKMVEYKQNEFVHLAAVKDHYLNPPKVDEIVFQTFSNQDALVQAIKTGQVDMITEMPNTAVIGLRNESNVQVVNGPSFYPSVADIIFNQVAPENCPPDDGLCTGHPALLDRQVRLALAHATDKKQIIDVVLLGLGDPGLTLIPNGLGAFYNDSIQDYAFDISLANQILDEAGYKDADGDGIRDMPDGSRPLTFRMSYPNDSTTAPRESEILKESWAQVGVGVEIQPLDPDALTSVCCPSFDFDIILWGWGSDPDPGFLLSVMLTDEIPTGNSETGYANPEYDALFTQQATELDKDKRIQLIWEMQQIVFDDVVYIIPYYEQSVQAYRTDRFTGWKTDGAKLDLSDISSLIAVEPVK
ncbi:MAG: ABC transporter substrate-binding protein [Anaerolineales bacterium]|nr:ABC transporter substrate-binding protein [Anaerolineales bacterium]